MGWRRAPHTAWRRLGQEVVVIDLQSNVMYGLDDAGGCVWESLGEEGAAPSAPEGPAVAGFLEELAQLGLVEGAGRAAPATPVQSPAAASPRILWREQVQRFGGSCGLRPGQGTPCGGKPVWS